MRTGMEGGDGHSRRAPGKNWSKNHAGRGSGASEWSRKSIRTNKISQPALASPWRHRGQLQSDYMQRGERVLFHRLPRRKTREQRGRSAIRRSGVRPQNRNRRLLGRVRAPPLHPATPNKAQRLLSPSELAISSRGATGVAWRDTAPRECARGERRGSLHRRAVTPGQ